MSPYTGRGDDGMTDLGTATRVSKADPRVEAYGTVDELNATIGTVRPTGYADVDETLETIQNHLHVLQAEFSNPDPAADDPTIAEAHVSALESAIDAYNEELPALESFIMPGGSDAGSHLHHARTVCRRAERRAVTLADDSDTIRTLSLTYLNRLSDLLFVLARAVNQRDGASEASPTY